MKKALLAFIFSAVLALPTLSALAQGPAATPPMPTSAPIEKIASPTPCVLPAFRLLNPNMVDVLASRINLAADQKKAVLDLLTKAEEAAKPKIEVQRRAAEKFIDTLSKPNVTEAELTAAGNDAMKAESDLLAEKIKTFTALQKILNDQQKKDLSKFIEGYSVIWHIHTPKSGS